MSALSDALNEANVNDWSSREISRRAEGRIHHATVSNFLRGRHAANPGDEVLQAFVDVFPTLDLPRLRELAGRQGGEGEPYVPPVEASRLNARQRKALDELIRSMAAEDSMARLAHDLLDRDDPDNVQAFLTVETEDFVAWALQRKRERDAAAHVGGVEPDFETVRALRQQREALDADDELPAAARTGKPSLREIRRLQDEAAEAPDPDGGNET